MRKRTKIIIKKAVYFLSFTIFFVALLTLSVYAESGEEKILSSIEKDLNNYKDTLPDFVRDFFPKGPLDGDFSTLTSNKISEKSYISFAASYLMSGIKDVLKSFSSILILLIIVSIFNSFKSSFTSSNLQSTFSLCSALCISISVFNLCISLCKVTITYVNALCNTMMAFLPIMGTLMLLGGQASSAAVSNASMILFISITDLFLITYMLPLVKMCLAFGSIKAISREWDFSGVSKTIKTTFVSVTVFVMSIFMFVLSYKNTLSQSIDSLSIKTARFAISSLVPVLGSSVNESLRTVTASLSVIKNSCGIIAIISIVILMIPLIINLFLNKLSFSILATISKLIGGTGESSILEEADAVCSFLLTLVCCTCVLFIFALTIFIKSNAGMSI